MGRASPEGVSVSVPLRGAFCLRKATFLEDCSLGDCCFSFPVTLGFLITTAFSAGCLLPWSLEEAWTFGTEGPVDNSESAPLGIPFCFWKEVFLGRCRFCKCHSAFTAPLAFLAGLLLLSGLGVTWPLRSGTSGFVGVDVAEFPGAKIKQIM